MDRILRIELRPGAATTRVHEHIEHRRLLPGAIREYTQTFGTVHRGQVGGHGEHAHLVVGPDPSPVGEDLPGAGEVKLLHVLEKRDADVHERR